jgi:protein farnesyltransferase/geranylgeranyltransferase type-1 subunit alpha
MSAFINKLKGYEDIIPIEQDEGPNPVARIDYNAEYVILMNTFRGILSIGEKTIRVYYLTERILEHNPANYTVWHYRRDIIRSLMNDYITNQQQQQQLSDIQQQQQQQQQQSKDNIIEEEIIFMDKFSTENPKNYQIWYHRRALVEIMITYDMYNNNDSIKFIINKELDFCELVCDTDNKNYHSWAHRQWILKTFNYWDNEIQYINKMIINDSRNNSAWNQRWFVIHNNDINDNIIRNELIYTINSINNIKLNESSWNYLRGLANHHHIIKNDIKEYCNKLVNDTDYNNHFAVALLAALREEDNSKESLEELEQFYHHLAAIDPIRKKVWNKKVEHIRQRLANL